VSLAYVGIGSNLQDPVLQVESAFDELQKLPQTRLVNRSSLYRSRPMGYAAQPDFVNAVAALETSLRAPDLLEALQKLEERHGRQRSFANAPRTLDLDILLYGDQTFAEKDLTIPHPRMHERAFVLKPLLEIAPQGISIPGIGAAAACLVDCADQSVTRIA
jgi:2-amino-4-hydroxy-6-hydroxymethyldihydropteridine diphosphokinase